MAGKSFFLSPRRKNPTIPSPNGSSDSLLNIDALREVVSIVERLKNDERVSKNNGSHDSRLSSKKPSSTKKAKR
jgi:hypothetical protein